jgi:hypothetical protein
METNNININYMGEQVNILQFLSESSIQFKNRLEYIKKLENAKINWKEAHRLSKIWYCIKYKNCKYMPDVYHKVIQYDK